MRWVHTLAGKVKPQILKLKRSSKHHKLPLDIAPFPDKRPSRAGRNNYGVLRRLSCTSRVDVCFHDQPRQCLPALPCRMTRCSRMHSVVGVWTPCGYVHHLLQLPHSAELLLPHLSTPPARLPPPKLPRPKCGAFISPPPYLCANASAPLCRLTWANNWPSCNRASCN